MLLDATKPQDGLNGTAGDAHGEGGDSGRATGSEVCRVLTGPGRVSEFRHFTSGKDIHGLLSNLSQVKLPSIKKTRLCPSLQSRELS